MRFSRLIRNLLRGAVAPVQDVMVSLKPAMVPDSPTLSR